MVSCKSGKSARRGEASCHRRTGGDIHWRGADLGDLDDGESSLSSDSLLDGGFFCGLKPVQLQFCFTVITKGT